MALWCCGGLRFVW